LPGLSRRGDRCSACKSVSSLCQRVAANWYFISKKRIDGLDQGMGGIRYATSVACPKPSSQQEQQLQCSTRVAGGSPDTKKPIRMDGLDMFRRRSKVSFEGNYLSEKLTSMFRATSTGTPFFIPGRNFHCLSAWMAFSSNPRPNPRTTFRISIVPSLRTIADRTTTP
jgi:hypothetical protein